MPTHRLAIFASGNGSNAQRISGYFAGNKEVQIVAVYCNNPNAFVLQRAQQLGLETMLFDRHTFYKTTAIADDLQLRGIEWIVLAGFLWLIPPGITQAYKGRIVNIHPALLPLHGGKGMYGQRVHEAVIAAGETQSGITIHYVNEQYDEGDIIFQATCPVEPGDTPDMLAARVHKLEYEFYPAVIERLLKEHSR